MRVHSGIKDARMKLTAAEARLLSTAEVELVRSKGPFEVKSLVRLIQRLRNLRDRASDLLRRQAVAMARSTGSKGGETGNANARSGDKVEVLGRALRYFEEHLAKLDAESTAAMKALRAEAKAEKAKKAEAAKAAADKAPAKKAAAKKAVAKKPAAKKAAAKKAVAKPAAKKSTAPAAEADSSETAAPAPAAEADSGGAPVQTISSKARLRLPKTIPGPDSGQLKSVASRKSPTKRGR